MSKNLWTIKGKTVKKGKKKKRVYFLQVPCCRLEKGEGPLSFPLHPRRKAARKGGRKTKGKRGKSNGSWIRPDENTGLPPWGGKEGRGGKVCSRYCSKREGNIASHGIERKGGRRSRLLTVGKKVTELLLPKEKKNAAVLP